MVCSPPKKELSEPRAFTEKWNTPQLSTKGCGLCGSHGALLRIQAQSVFRSVCRHLRQVLNKGVNGHGTVSVSLFNGRPNDSAVEVQQRGSQRRCGTHRKCPEIPVVTISDFQGQLLWTAANFGCVGLADLVHALEHAQVGFHVAGDRKSVV